MSTLESKIQPGPEAGVLQVIGSVNFKNVVKLRNQGQYWLAQQTSQAVVVDLQGVASSDNSGLVLLVAWLRDARHAQKTLVFRHVPKFLLRMAEVFGLNSVIKSVIKRD